jgi:hypothetical protein
LLVVRRLRRIVAILRASLVGLLLRRIGAIVLLLLAVQLCGGRGGDWELAVGSVVLVALEESDGQAHPYEQDPEQHHQGQDSGTMQKEEAEDDDQDPNDEAAVVSILREATAGHTFSGT